MLQGPGRTSPSSQRGSKSTVQRCQLWCAASSELSSLTWATLFVLQRSTIFLWPWNMQFGNGYRLSGMYQYEKGKGVSGKRGNSSGLAVRTYSPHVDSVDRLPAWWWSNAFSRIPAGITRSARSVRSISGRSHIISLENGCLLGCSAV
jgi:hypothetical protein